MTDDRILELATRHCMMNSSKHTLAFARAIAAAENEAIVARLEKMVHMGEASRNEVSVAIDAIRARQGEKHGS